MRILFLTIVGSLLAGCRSLPPPKPSPCRYVAGDRSPGSRSTSGRQRAREKEDDTGGRSGPTGYGSAVQPAHPSTRSPRDDRRLCVRSRLPVSAQKTPIAASIRSFPPLPAQHNWERGCRAQQGSNRCLATASPTARGREQETERRKGASPHAVANSRSEPRGGQK
jgi:hypothetical protein